MDKAPLLTCPLRTVLRCKRSLPPLYRDMDKTENLGRLAQCKDIQNFVKSHFVFGVSEQSIEEKWTEFQTIYPGRATDYMTYWMKKKKRWCRPWWALFFTAMKTCNAMGESNNSVLKVSYGFETDTLVGVIQATHQRATQTRVEDLRDADKNYIAVQAAKAQLVRQTPGSVDAQLLECKTLFATHVYESLKKSIQKTTHYSAVSETETVVVVSKPGGQLFPVKKDPTTGLWECKTGCGKGTYKGRPCVHQLKVFQLKNPLYINTHGRWSPSTITLLAYYMDLRKKEADVGVHDEFEIDDGEDYGPGDCDDSDSSCPDDASDDSIPGRSRYSRSNYCSFKLFSRFGCPSSCRPSRS